MPLKAADGALDDVQVLGAWNFTLQGDTPLYWLRTGQLDRYLLRFRVTCPSPCVCGIVLHSEVDGPGTDGASFWIERRFSKDGKEVTRRYVLAGDGLESKPIVTRSFPDQEGEHSEDVEVLMEGYSGTILLQDRKVSLRFRAKHSKGSVAFYNSTQGDNDDVHFGGIRITALRRGPLEIDGKLLKRERYLDKFAAEGTLGSEEELSSPMRTAMKGSTMSAGFDSRGSTMAPDSMATRLRSTTTLGTGTTHGASAFGGNSTNFRATLPAAQQHLPSPSGSTRSPMQLGGRRGAAKARLKMSASDGALRKSGSSLLGGGYSSAGGSGAQASPWDRPKGGRGGEQWIPLALNAPAGEQALLKTVSQKPLNSRACTDFIAM